MNANTKCSGTYIITVKQQRMQQTKLGEVLKDGNPTLLCGDVICIRCQGNLVEQLQRTGFKKKNVWKTKLLGGKILALNAEPLYPLSNIY